MAKYLYLYCGFESPSDEFMQQWNDWFAKISDRTVNMGGLGNAREISDTGVAEQPFGPDSITGYSLIEAKDLDEATEIAKDNPYVASIRILEVREH